MIIYDQKPVHHFYHIYADGHWREPIIEHFEAANGHGLLTVLDSLQIGIVGSPPRRLEVIQQLERLSLDFQVVDEQETGFEQVTMNKLADFSQITDGYVLYAHTKGAFQNDELRTRWRRRMCKYNVIHWRDCLDALMTHDAVGIHWMTSHLPEHVGHNGFFAGTYWWSHLKYLRHLPYPKQETRWNAEGWIGLNQSITVKDFFPHSPYVSHA